MEINSGSTLRRSVGGIRKSQRPINPISVYDYALRCAIRACLEQTSNLRPNSQNSRSEKDRRSVHLGVSDMLGSLTERFGDESKPDKLTREVVRALLRRLDDIKKGKDSSKIEYREQRFLNVVAQVQKSVQQHRYRPSGTINDLVIVFLKTSETEFKKENPNMVAWRDDLTRYVARFAEILKQTVQEDAPSSSSPELIDKLNGFIGSSTKTSRQLSDKRNQSGPGSPLPSLAYGSIESFESFPMIKTVQALFQVDPIEHRRKLRELQPICTQSAFMHDLKKCINNVHTNQPYPAKSDDFPNRQTYDAWQKREVKQLSELLKTLTLLDPNLSMNAGDHDTNAINGNRSSLYDPSSAMTGFTFIPSDPRAYFRLLMNMCIDYDTEIIPDSERAKTSVLSQQSDDLLRECWRTWRLSAPFRTVLYVELIKKRFDEGVFNMDDIRDAIRTLDKALKENDINSWTLTDRASLNWIYEGMERTFMRELANGLSEYWKISPDWIRDLVSMLDRIYENPFYLSTHPNPLGQFQSLVETVEGAAVERWRSLEKACIKDEDDLTNLLTLADKLIKELVSLATKKFKSPIKGVLSIPGIVMTIQMPYFALEMENWAYLPAAQDAPIEVTFNLYHKVLSLKRLYDQYGPQQKAALFKVESWFLSHVRRWLKTTDGATPEWVGNAIKQDEFKPTNDITMHSSSIVDLFSLFHQSVDFVQKLQWPNEYQRCRFMTALSKVIGVALTQYTYALEDMITEDIYPHTIHDRNAPGSHSFLDKAKLQLTGNRSSLRPDSIPDDFTIELCVKINDIEAARSRLDRLYQIMDVDEIAEYLRENGGVNIEKEDQINFLYSIKAVRAENLQAKDSNGLSDPYVILEIDGKQVCRTRTVYETLNPRWDQTFDLWLGNETVSVLAVVYDEDLLTAHDECGGAWFKLSPEYFDDYQSHEMVLDLHPQGKLMLRITMEGEKDDIQFWFGKAFRTLKRAENDAAGLIVDRMGRYIRHCLSRKILDKLLCRDRSFFSSFSRTNNKLVEPTLQDCEDAINPLLDYLERNLKILNDHLSETNMQLVILKIWKEILIALEGVLLPPLSEHLSDMKPLDDYEFHIVYKWLELLKVLFNGGEDGDAVPLEKLENSHYYALLAINVAYNLETEQLMESYHAAVNNQAELKQRGGRKADRSKSVYHSKNTVRKKKTPKKVQSVAATAAASIDLPSGEVILRILRMRSGKNVREFLRTEFEKRNNAPPPVPPHAVTAVATSLRDSSINVSAPPLPPLPPLPNTKTSSLPPPPPVPAHSV
ncbi:uncharacterized protein BX664DRAFT_291795 [Halteromyces radiatus]|uniref:uncharacterized protein n=1 Tax=Halteromyces radiatus TaxID=101107 RepID=UPI002220AD4F|nr:uncharacterized protein BX664DRAFT_291795 [Halteromyces radiatus]KAI8096728.1 hypothetical protein BX664DRAFT_291795 [Halteromyces radiatus]